jgi:large subunit ribosomal protein L35
MIFPTIASPFRAQILAPARENFSFIDKPRGVGERSCCPTPRIGPMPKQKTHKASRKRFRVTASGKLKRSQAGKKHLNSHKTGKRKRHLRAKLVETGVLAAKYVAHVGNI